MLHTYIYIYIYVYMYESRGTVKDAYDTYIHIQVYICIYICIYGTYIYIYICTYVWVTGTVNDPSLCSEPMRVIYNNAWQSASLHTYTCMHFTDFTYRTSSHFYLYWLYWLYWLYLDIVVAEMLLQQWCCSNVCVVKSPWLMVVCVWCIAWPRRRRVLCCCVSQCVAVCSVLQCVAMRCSTWSIAWPRLVLQCIAVFCSVLQCHAVCCSGLKWRITWAQYRVYHPLI